MALKKHCVQADVTVNKTQNSTSISNFQTTSANVTSMMQVTKGTNILMSQNKGFVISINLFYIIDKQNAA
jgi:hypothetical protein